MSETYEFVYDEDGTVEACDCCHQRVPIRRFKEIGTHGTISYDPPRALCQFCAKTMADVHVRNGYPDGATMAHICAVANILLAQSKGGAP